MGSGDCECSHPTSHMASEKWEVGLKRGFPFLKYPTLAISHEGNISEVPSRFYEVPRRCCSRHWVNMYRAYRMLWHYWELIMQRQTCQTVIEQFPIFCLKPLDNEANPSPEPTPFSMHCNNIFPSAPRIDGKSNTNESPTSLPDSEHQCTHLILFCEERKQRKILRFSIKSPPKGGLVSSYLYKMCALPTFCTPNNYDQAWKSR